MMLVYYEGKGVWFDFPSVDSQKRFNAYKKWVAENMPDTSGGDRNDDDREKYSTKLAEWNKNNPPPKYKVVEDEISLEREHFFDLSEPVLSYQPEEDSVSAIFKLKAKDERRLRYKGEVTVSKLLPCDHPDGDRSGFFFQLDAPKTFTRNDIVQDVPDKPDQDGINVFFRGYGAWYGLFSDYSGERITSDQATGNSLTSGFFRLSEEDEIAYKYTNNYDDCEWLYPSTHPNDEFTKFMKKWGEIEREQWHREAYEANQESGHLGTYYHLEGFAFKIDTSRNRKFFEPEKPLQPKAVVNNGTGSQVAAESASAKVIQAETVGDIDVISQDDGWQDDFTLSKRKKQHKAILEVIKSKNFKPLAIPDGEKGTIQKICEIEYPLLFDGDTSFDNAWKKGRELFCMANHASYAKRGKQ